MKNLIQNYKIILKELTNIRDHIESIKQIRVPKLSDLEVVTLNITDEYMSINFELLLFMCISRTDLKGNIERSGYNRRKRIETAISQLGVQFSININFAKNFLGPTTRIVSKITTFTMIQYLNFFMFRRSLNKPSLNAQHI